MPLDSTEKPARPPATQAGLAMLLRDRSHWPPGFVWYYRLWEDCLLGLCKRVYPDELAAIQVDDDGPDGTFERIARLTGCDRDRLHEACFDAVKLTFDGKSEQVSPELVAWVLENGLPTSLREPPPPDMARILSDRIRQQTGANR